MADAGIFRSVTLAAALMVGAAPAAQALDLGGIVDAVSGANVSDPRDRPEVQDEVEYQDTSREEREYQDTSREEREHLDHSREEREYYDSFNR